MMHPILKFDDEKAKIAPTFHRMAIFDARFLLEK